MTPKLGARRHGLRQALGLAAAACWPASWAATPAPAVIRGAGASFPSKVYARWARDYGASHPLTLDYRASGSGDGVRQAIARSVPFAGTDAPLSEAELARHRLVQLPLLVGGLAPVVNLPGLEGRRLRLSGPLLAEIMAGQVERWDDPRLAELNPGLALPARRIVRVVRADKSGSTEGFTRYLSAVSRGFAAQVGVSGLPAWPGVTVAAEGNDGVEQAVRAQAGAIAYLSADRAGAEGLATPLLRNRDGAWLQPSEAGFRAAILRSELHRGGSDTASLLDAPGAETWPITLTSFVLLDAAPERAEAVEPVLRFLYWCFMRGDLLTRGTGFAPLPVTVQACLASRLAAVRPRDGRLPRYETF